MRIIVGDTSCIIDFGKGRLVREVLQLPYTFEHSARHQSLTVKDRFTLAFAEQREDCNLLTGDASLRRIAEATGLEVHGRPVGRAGNGDRLF